MRSPVLSYMVFTIIGIVTLLAFFKDAIIEKDTLARHLTRIQSSIHELTGELNNEVADLPKLRKNEEEIQFENLLNGDGPLYLAADNPKLIQHVLKHVLIPPSPLPYNLTHPETKNSSPEGQIQRVMSILKNKKNGFFIEAGALTGEFWSNSLSLERFSDWNGLLVEASPISFKELATKNRKAWSANCCLSPKSYPIKVVFDPAYATGNIVDTNTSKVKANQVVVQCYPLLTLLLAINQTYVDYISLDIQGGEMDVIRNLPLDTINVKVFSIEDYFIPGGKPAVADYLKQFGYKYHSKVLLDMFFVKT